MLELFDMISQIGIAGCGISAVYLVGRTDYLKRYGYLIGLCSQPFWFYTTIYNQQYILIIMAVFYTYSWIHGLINYWKR